MSGTCNSCGNVVCICDEAAAFRKKQDSCTHIYGIGNVNGDDGFIMNKDIINDIKSIVAKCHEYEANEIADILSVLLTSVLSNDIVAFYQITMNYKKELNKRNSLRKALFEKIMDIMIKQNKNEIWKYHSSHVFYTNTLASHFLQFKKFLYESFNGVDRAYGVRNASLGMSSHLVDRIYWDLQIPHVI